MSIFWPDRDLVNVATNMSERTAAPEELPDNATANNEKLPLQSKKLQKLRKAYEKKGIVYVSRIPPHMVRVG